MVLKGKVKSGLNDFSYWMNKLEKYYTQKTGIKLFPGTLNVELEIDFHLPKNCIKLEKEEYGGTVSVSIFPCKINGRNAFVLRTDKNASGKGFHPLNIIEIAADVKLRDLYNLRDDDIVEIEL